MSSVSLVFLCNLTMGTKSAPSTGAALWGARAVLSSDHGHSMPILGGNKRCTLFKHSRPLRVGTPVQATSNSFGAVCPDPVAYAPHLWHHHTPLWWMGACGGQPATLPVGLLARQTRAGRRLVAFHRGKYLSATSSGRHGAKPKKGTASSEPRLVALTHGARLRQACAGRLSAAFGTTFGYPLPVVAFPVWTFFHTAAGSGDLLP